MKGPLGIRPGIEPFYTCSAFASPSLLPLPRGSRHRRDWYTITYTVGGGLIQEHLRCGCGATVEFSAIAATAMEPKR